MSRHPIYSIGHSDLPIQNFIAILKRVGVTAIADVRTYPVSKRAPWYSKDDLEEELYRFGVEYRFLGEELGGRPKGPGLFRDGIANYEAMARTDQFQFGLRRVLSGSKNHSVALLCSEKDPLHCHRCLLVSRELESYDVNVTHLHHNGSQETQPEVEARLLREEGMEDPEMPLLYRLERAYKARSRRVAYATSDRKIAQAQMGFLD